MKAYFVSDLHLKHMSQESAQQFRQFLTQLGHDSDLTHLFLVGDIFDLWISKHFYFIEKFRPLIALLSALKKRGVEIHYFEGNHDLYLKDFWAEEMGFHVHADAVTLALGSYQVRVEHGDLIDKEDRGYRFLRWFLRTPAMTWLARSLPSSWVAWIGKNASHASRTYTSEVKTITNDKALQKVRAHAARIPEPVDFLISGHLHVQDDFTVTTRAKRVRSINLGSWFDGAKAFLLSDNEQKFVSLN